MAVLTPAVPAVASAPSGPKALVPGLALVGGGVAAASLLHLLVGGVPLIVAAVAAGVIFTNVGVISARMLPGVRFAAKTLLRAGIVLLGLRLSVGDVADLGLATLVLILVTVVSTFFGVHYIGRRLGLSQGLSLLVASGFSICGNSAIASVQGVAEVDDEEVAAAVGLVTLCGTLAIIVVPSLGSALGLSDVQLGVWAGASVQDTAQVVAVASTAGPAVLAVATAVKLTRVLFLAPIVAGVALRNARRCGRTARGERPAVLPLFVVGFLATVLVRTTGLVPDAALDLGRHLEQYLLAAGMVGLGSSVHLPALRRLGVKPLVLGAAAWVCVASVALVAISVLGIS